LRRTAYLFDRTSRREVERASVLQGAFGTLGCGMFTSICEDGEVVRLRRMPRTRA
jgi:hypothetical protein